MADSPPQSAPWFDSLTGIATTAKRSASDSVGDRPLSPHRPGNSRRVNPVHGDVEAAAAKTIARSEPSSPDLSIPSSPSSFSFSKGGLHLVPSSSFPDSPGKDNGIIVQPEDRPSLRQYRAKRPAPVLPLPLPPPPALSSPAVHSISFQYPVATDFYFEPSIKYDLGPAESETSRSRRICCCVLTTILIILVVLGITVGILAVKLNPKQPSISIGDLQVTSLNFSESGGVSQLEMGMDFSVNIINSNKHAKVIYNQISMTVSYNNTLALGNMDIRGFVQGNRRSTSVTPDNIETVTTVPADVAVALRGDVTNSNVQLNLRGSASGRYKILWFIVNNFSVPINCQLNVKPADEGQEAEILSNTCYTNAR